MMHAAAQLALMSKAARVFADDGSFLSFPVTPLSFAREELELLSATSIGRLVEFSLLANRIPSGGVWPTEAGAYLWDVYGKVLDEGVYATSSRTPQEEAAYRAAQDFLFTQDGEGTRTPSRAAIAYRTYRDRYLILQQDYAAQRSTAEATTNPHERQHWADEIAPRLTQGLERALADWEGAGQRGDVERAEATYRQLGAKSPHATWAGWAERFNEDTATLTRASDNQVVYPTTYSPENALDDASWRWFTLSQDEIASAIANAPPEMRERLGHGQGGPAIATLDFEFSSAGLVRPWLASDAFRARFWKFPDPAVLLCDGSVPGDGLCPAYASGIIFARKIRVTLKPSSEGSTGVYKPTLSFDLVKAVAARPPDLAGSLKPIAPSRPAIAVRTAPIRLDPHLVAAPPPVMTAPAARPAPQPTRLSPAALGRLRGSVFERAPSSGSAPAPPAATPADDGAVHILAFICTRLPRCPDPDGTLTW